MPNHVTTICTVTGPDDAIARFEASHFRIDDGRQAFDFDTVIPRPDVIRATESSSTADDAFYALTGLLPQTFGWGTNPITHMPGASAVTTREQYREYLKRTNPKAIEQGEAQLKAFRETGYRTWYDWCVDEWGTKWGAYDYEKKSREAGRLVFQFDTAWSFPVPVFRVLAGMYPDLVFAVISYDEGSNFACDGEFNGANDFRKVPATPEMYRRVYGRDQDADDDDDGAPAAV